MYWTVGGEEITGSMEDGTNIQNGAVGMGNKQSILGGASWNQSPTIENIQAAYQEREIIRAQELIKRSCTENTLRREKCELLSLAAAHGDLEAVQYLLKEAKVSLLREPSDHNPAVLAASYGHEDIVKELLESLSDLSISKELLNWMLAVACQQGHLDLVKLLVLTYKADPESCAVRKNDFPVITGLPLYAAVKTGNEEIAAFLIQNGAIFSSYILMDHPKFSKRLMRNHFIETNASKRIPTEEAFIVRWSNLKLPWLDLDWFIDISYQITELDISANCLVSLPSVVPWGLINLQKLNLSDNQLSELPSVLSSEEILCTRLLEIDVSNNQLTSLPPGFLHLSRLQKVVATKNQLEKLFQEDSATNWIGLRRLQELNVSENKLTELPPQIVYCFKMLTSLDVSNNNLKVFPEPWACPLKYCKAAQNSVEALPNNFLIYWKNCLEEIDFSDNSLKAVPEEIFQLEALMSLKLSGNRLAVLPSPEHWACSQLKSLDLSRNQFGKNEEEGKTKRATFFTAWTRIGTDTVTPPEFPQFLSETLEVLCLNNNFLDSVPQSVCCLKGLTELYLGNNPGIRELPTELGQLCNLWQLDIEELNINNIPAEIRREGPRSILGYLRAQLRKAEKFKLLKMIVVGPPRQGKSTLLEVLQTGKTPQMMQSDSSIKTTMWELLRPGSYKAKIDSVEFNVWDIGGPASMSTVNQCFFTDKALYVVVWNLALGEEAVANLQSWLLNIEAKAPNATVIVVGTHLDLIETKFRTERIATLRAYVLALCRSPSGTKATGYPDITIRHLHEVSCKTLEGLEGLRKLIFHATCCMKDVGSIIGSQNLVGRLIPKSYLSLKEAVLAEQQRRAAVDEVQYLTDKEIEEIVAKNPNNDIKDYEDLQTAIGFLIETGTLLHFPDTSHGLRNLYFLDPVWLSECIERIINIKSSKSMAKNGVIKASDLRMLLVGTGFTEKTEEQYFQFLAKFDVALPVGNNSYLLPHLLPTKPGLDIHSMRHKTINTIQRWFKMSFVPVGFWQRLIARMLISLAEMDLQLFENKKGPRVTRNRNTVIYSFTGNQQRNRCSTFRVRRSQTVYWQEGLMVTFEGGYLSVESSDVNWKKKKSGGIKIICQSEARDFSAMAFVTDHVNSLIDQWFPALTATESDGSLLMEQYVPCPICGIGTKASNATKKQESTHEFNMEDCVVAAVEMDHIACPNHTFVPVPLQELVPELFMTDFPARLFLENNNLEYEECESNVLGQGGSGTIIYLARYQQMPVAVKRFHFRKSRVQSLDSTADAMLRHLQAMEALRNFSEFRQEASMLHSLQHPCIVSLIGISIHPLCFALQLAPLGSLNMVLSDNSKGASFMPLGHMLTYRIAYQVAAGLAYLHRKNIIFCDLKSDNILVWSLEVNNPVNVKLSDYGISRQSFHEGALGVEGTPGYQAPEIRPGIVYDEKVDMFSFGMVLYELLSGLRPFRGQHQHQIAKKFSKGIRPVLGHLEEVQFHSLQTLMIECWDTKPEKRPVASSLVKQMQDPGFPTFKYMLPCGKQSLFFSSQEQDYTVVFWDGEGIERNYTVVNIEKGLAEVQRMKCPGIKLRCQVKIQNSIWIATEDQKIHVYSLKNMCPLSVPQKIMNTPAVVTCFLAVPQIKRVFTGLADGLVGIYSLFSDTIDDNCSYLCSHTANKTKFKISDDDPRQNPYSVETMVPLGSGSEVWYSNGPGILVIDCSVFEIVRRLEPYDPPSLITSMTCSSDCNGEVVVWCLDDKTNSLLMFHATTYQLCSRYFCGDVNPLRDMFAIQQPSRVIPPTSTINNTINENGNPSDISIIYSEVGTQIIRHQDSLTDYCSLSSYSSSPLKNNRSYSSMLSSPVSLSSIPFSTDCEESDRSHDLNLPSDRSENIISPTEEGGMEHLQAVKVLAVKDTLWIPRKGGDTIVIELQKESETQRGKVIAVLKAAALAPYSSLVEAAVVAKDTVVCCFENENMEWCLAVWRGWGAREFDIFYQSYEELGRLEISMRKRR
ncbi:leucine-rich repeat serine/threonine-protein kinase 1 [Latimeria chalumnae]|uniref:leucine-rich repeat serine/threonine-protein kinase 1 n=1 Tax=Latimeria chalumnae TaxID=7897 RepID=UPI00313E1EE0